MNFWKGKYNSSKTSTVHVECSCDHLAESFMSKFWKLFAGIPKNLKNWWACQKTYLSNFPSEHVQRSFDRPAVTRPAKVHRIFFAHSLKMIAMQLFGKNKFSFLSPFKKRKKSSSGHAKCSCGNPAKKFFVKFLKTFAGYRETIKNWWAYQKILLVRIFVWTCTMFFLTSLS